jgi:hypothetical protein
VPPPADSLACSAQSKWAQASTLLKKRRVKQSPNAFISPTNHVKLDPPTCSKRRQFIRASGRVASVTASANKHGLTAPSSLASGEKIALMEKENLFTLMAMCTMASGQTTRQMAPALISTLMEPCTRVNGRMIYSMDAVLRLGLTRVGMKATTLSDASTASEATSGTMEVNILVTGAKTKLAESECIAGSMAVDTKVNGWKITWRAWESTYGMMGVCTRASIKMTKNMDLAFIPGLMAAATRGTGIEANSMDSAPMWFPKTTKLNMVSGKTANVSSGLMRHRFRRLTTNSWNTLVSSTRRTPSVWWTRVLASASQCTLKSV